MKLTLVALAGLVAAVLAAGAASALAQEASEARISARRLADGRIEFALQQRAGRGWSERVLPASRYFPANAAVGRWLNSSPVMGDARISARRLADGRIEFALQQQNTGGGWGERVLPASRYFPANAAVGRWLNSSPVRIGAAMMTPDAAPAECSLANHIDRVLAATFEARTASGRGTAFYIGNGEWLTNHHVVEDAARLTLVRDGVRLAAAVAGSLPGYDLALLRAQPPASVRPLRLAASRTAVAASVAVAGFPPGVSGTPSISRGVVSKYAPFAGLLAGSGGILLRTDASINPGNSGGPIVDDCGAVVGVATFVSTYDHRGRQVEGLGLGVAAETIAAKLASLRSTSHAPEAPAPPDEPPAPTPRITAICTHYEHEELTADECRDRPVDRNFDGWWWSIRGDGIIDWDNVIYRFNGGDGFPSSEMGDRLGALPSGCHEIAAAVAGVWSEPYPFCVEAYTLRVTAICTYAEDEPRLTSEECRDRPVDRNLYTWTIRAVGVTDWDEVRYRLNGEDWVPGSDVFTLLWALPSGCHEIAIAEAGVWSEPYPFCVEAYTPRITAFCSFDQYPPRPTWEECRDMPVNTDDRRYDMYTSADVDLDEVLYRINGEGGVTRSEMWQRLRALPFGCHEIAIANVSAPGLWSAPHRFCLAG